MRLKITGVKLGEMILKALTNFDAQNFVNYEILVYSSKIHTIEDPSKKNRSPFTQGTISICPLMTQIRRVYAMAIAIHHRN